MQRCTSASLAEDVADRTAQRLAAVDHEQDACSGSRPRSTRSASSAVATGWRSRSSPPTARAGPSRPRCVIPSATTWVRSLISSAVEHHHRQAHVLEPPRHQLAEVLARCARRTRATPPTCSSTAHASSTSLPTGSRRAREAARRDAGEHPLHHRRVSAGHGRRSAHRSATAPPRSSSAVRTRGRLTRTRRPPSVTPPSSWP